MTIRKNFLLDDEIAKHLEELAKKENTTQTNIIKNMIEEKYQEISVQEKLDAINVFAGSMTGLLGDDVSIQSIKMEMGSKI
jgi:predicted transcriptional regulator